MKFQKGMKRSIESVAKQKETLRKNREKKEERKLKREAIERHIENVEEKIKTEEPKTISNSHILAEINLQKEFDTMTEKINPKQKPGSTDMKYECVACGYKFNTKGEGGVCPGCGVELE